MLYTLILEMFVIVHYGNKLKVNETSQSETTPSLTRHSVSVMTSRLKE